MAKDENIENEMTQYNENKYKLVDVTTSTQPMIEDDKGNIFSNEEVLLKILNKVDKIERSLL